MKTNILIEEFGQNGIRTSSKEIVATLDSKAEDWGHTRNHCVYSGKDWFDDIMGAAIEFFFDKVIQVKAVDGNYTRSEGSNGVKRVYTLILESVPLEVVGGNTLPTLVGIGRGIVGKTEDEQFESVYYILRDLHTFKPKRARLEEEGVKHDWWEGHESYKRLVISGLTQTVFGELWDEFHNRNVYIKNSEMVMRKIAQELESYIETKRVQGESLL